MLAPLIVSRPERSFPLATVLPCSRWAFVALPNNPFQLDLHLSTVPLLSPLWLWTDRLCWTCVSTPWSPTSCPIWVPLVPDSPCSLWTWSRTTTVHEVERIDLTRGCERELVFGVNSSQGSLKNCGAHAHTRARSSRVCVCASDAGVLSADLLKN